ncbi:hypothetical protein J056_000749 [Wallemia ichthyophaga EXF-994]|uniref:Pyridoxamine 5'-phosphate oxidase Alr4036 family FMN-binding domain-containing protein n=1 Tax=Wallemia ichthyophaga (strain EXF-994 / CBS 113033) TaxID=1299270 RepID=R9AKG4_WALI9|nr:uncharacterized protein J056_000749 [Wallemia ichthyophaga EXF-994]EOR00551.1 hypothetical protein J056_000749 [Wallemia ichthyophaga EXF-994]
MSRSTQVTITAAPWKSLLENTLNENKEKTKNIFNVAVGTVQGNRPRVRMMVHRAFQGNLLLTTTDIRMNKIHQLEDSYVDNKGSPIDYVFWIEPAIRQFRFTGNAFLLPSPCHRNPTPLSDYLINSGIDFEQKRIDIYNSMSRSLRASFAKPFSPGSHRSWDENSHPSPDKVESDDQDEWYQKGLDNFALLVVDPFQVDYCDLLTQPNQRKVFTLNEQNAWIEEDVHP